MSRREPAVGIERMLFDAARSVDFPETPDLVPAVLAAIEARPSARPATPRWNKFAYAAAASLVILGPLAASPSVRDAVADFIGVPGIRVESGPTPKPTPSTLDLNLGDAVSLDEASTQVSFDIALPEGVEVDSGFVADDVPGRRVSLLFEAQEGLPPTEETRVGALLVQFQGSTDEGYIKKMFSTGTRLRSVKVDGPFGGPGYWISGDPHVLSFLDQNGDPVRDETRLAGNTLIWISGGTTFRLESALGRAEALEFAASLR